MHYVNARREESLAPNGKEWVKPEAQRLHGNQGFKVFQEHQTG